MKTYKFIKSSALKKEVIRNGMTLVYEMSSLYKNKKMTVVKMSEKVTEPGLTLNLLKCENISSVDMSFDITYQIARMSNNTLIITFPKGEMEYLTLQTSDAYEDYAIYLSEYNDAIRYESNRYYRMLTEY